MENIILSKNGMYFITENTMYSVIENKTYNLEEVSLPKWLDILSENTKFSLKNNLTEVKDLASYHRRVTYQLMEGLSNSLRTSLMLEYEGKFGNLLLVENTVLIEGWFSDAWDWTKDKVGKAANWVTDKLKEFGSFAVKTGKDFLTCITSGTCSPLFEDFRDMLFSPVGIAIETFLTATGIGGIGPIVAWGIMALYDTYLLISGSPDFSWLNLIFDILGIGLGTLAKAAKGIFESAGLFAKGAGKSLEGIVEVGMKNPSTKGILVKLANSGIAQKSKSVIESAGKFMSEKLGLKWIGKVTNVISEKIASVLEAIGVSSKKAGVTTAQAVKRGMTAGGIAGAVGKGVEYLSGGGAAGGIEKGVGNEVGKGVPVLVSNGSFDTMYQNDLNNLEKAIKVA